MYLNVNELDALSRLTDGISDKAIVRLSRTDSLSNELPWDDSVGWLRVRVWDPAFPAGGEYVADDVVSDTGSITNWLRQGGEDAVKAGMQA